jgi:uncharacterized membrane protein
MQATVNVAGATAARGAACVGFYSSGSATSYGGLPPAGKNYNAPTYDDKSISVTSNQVVCQWTVGETTYELYESITVNVLITVGSWYVRDFYGFGYYGTESDPTVYVYIKVEQPITDSSIGAAYLYIYKGGTKVATVDLKSGSVTGSPITLSPGDGLQLDLSIRATGTTSVTFKVGFYATYSSTEAPR